MVIATFDANPAYKAVPLEGLAGRAPLPFPLFLRTQPSGWVLYRDVRTDLDEEHLGRLQSEGVSELWVREEDRPAYFARVESAVDAILRDEKVPLGIRADVLHGVAVRVAEDLLAATPRPESVRRSQRVMIATAGLLLREQQGFQAVRRVLEVSQTQSRHGLTVGFLAMGLARQVLAADTNVLAMAGLAGLLHDSGRVGHEHVDHDHDPQHTARGAALLQSLHLPEPVVESALFHHERWDGSGPHEAHANSIPEVARLVGLVDTFDDIYTRQNPRVGVYDALAIMAEAYRGCFDDRLAKGFVGLFA